MKVFFLVLTFFFLQMIVKPQTNNVPAAKLRPLPEWFRVYTYDDSIIELNTNYVMFSTRKIERVRFRWLFQTPQFLRGAADISYRSILQEIQFDCKNANYRFYAIQWYNAGKLVASENRQESDDWQRVGFGSMMEKLFIPACKLIERRKREPATEK